MKRVPRERRLQLAVLVYPMVMVTERRKRGDLGESIAVQFLTGKGYEIVTRNYLKPWGEIDIIARKDGTYRFVEVKTISRENIATTAEDHVHPKKLERLARTAELYMAHIPGDYDFQIDLVTVLLNHESKTARCMLYEQLL